MILLTSREAEELDFKVMNKWKIKEEALMETAGSKAVQIIERNINLKNKSVAVLCGSGNNGGDGYVAARYLKNLCVDVVILENGHMEKQGQTSKHYRQIAEEMNIPFVYINNEKELKEQLFNKDILIDALIGSGLKKILNSEKIKLIEAINEYKGTVISLDIPSGLSGTDGQMKPVCVNADYTIAMGTLKRGHVLYPGIEYCGKTIVADIGYPYIETEKYPVKIFTETEAEKTIPKRNRITHKGKNGHIGIYAGSYGMEGASLLAASGALYAGAGKISLNVTEKVSRSVKGKIKEVMVSALEDGEYFTQKSIEFALEKAMNYKTIILGCGIGRNEETQKFVKEILTRYDGKIIADADALYAIADQHINLSECKAKLILTPHVGEFSKLTGKDKKEIERNRIDEAIRYAKENKVTVVLKGFPTVTADENGNAFVNTTGNAGMASGGSGDVLSGIIAVMNAQIENTLYATSLGVYMHGKSGDILLKEKGIGYTASELAQTLPYVRKMSENKK